MNARQRLVAVVTFLAGLYFVVDFLLPEAVLARLGTDRYDEQITNGFVVVGSAAFGLGIVNLGLVHGSRIVFGRPGAAGSAALLFGLVLMTVVTSADWAASARTAGVVHDVGLASRFAEAIRDDAARVPSDGGGGAPGGDSAGVRRPPPYPERVEALRRYGGEVSARATAALAGPGSADTPTGRALAGAADAARASLRGLSETPGPGSSDALTSAASAFDALAAAYGEDAGARYEGSAGKGIFKIMNEGLFNSLGSAMFSLLAVYIAAAAFRAFRIRSVESCLMMVTAVLVMLGQTPFGPMMYEGMPAVRNWLLSVPNAGAFRAIRIGAAVAGLVLSVRMWLSLDEARGGET